MKNILVTILILFGTLTGYSQSYDSVKNSWDKIFIVDRYGGWSHFSNALEIKRSGTELILVNKNDSVLNTFEPTLLDKFFASLAGDSMLSEDPLRMFGKDSIWLVDNAEDLWLSYLGDKDEPAKIDSFAVNVIKNYKKVKKLVWDIQGFKWTDDYPFTSVLIIKNTDTLRIHSLGQYPYMMPWIINDKIIYNYKVPSSISGILPTEIKSNKLRLSGEGFDYYLIDRIYQSFIKKYHDYYVARLKYPTQFSVLERHYNIEKAELKDMGSIEWGGFMSAPCLELVLRNKELPTNVSFNVVLGRRIKLHSIGPIIRKQDKLIDQLTNNHVYQYTIENFDAIGKIHFVNKKSLSGQAKRNFKSDLKDNGMKKNLFIGRFRNAIFYELTEYKGKDRSFSRWIFLRDGTTILWEIEGSFLMDLSPDIVKEKGYVCKIIKNFRENDSY